MEEMLQIRPPCELVSPDTVAPPEATPVEPKFGSGASKVITVLVYVCAATVPEQLSSHSVPVPHPIVKRHEDRYYGIFIIMQLLPFI